VCKTDSLSKAPLPYGRTTDGKPQYLYEPVTVSRIQQRSDIEPRVFDSLPAPEAKVDEPRSSLAMKLFNRIRFITALGICSLLYFSGILSSLKMKVRLRKALSRSSVRLVVFGDDWSDTGTYRKSPPPRGMVRKRLLAQGPLWTEALCREVRLEILAPGENVSG
jgi:hypothetical protein